MKTKLPKLVLGFLVLTMVLNTHGQFVIDWSTIDGGGGTSSGGAYAVSGTIGQPDAEQMAGGVYTLSGGFWGAGAPILPPLAPALTLSRLGSSLVVKWPFPSTGFVLQQTTALASPTAMTPWTEVTSPSAIKIGAEWTVTIPSPAGNRFIRLRKP